MTPAVVPASRRPTFRRIRVAILLAVLIVTAAWGASTAYKRAIRGRWQRPLQAGIVLLAPGGGVNAEHWRQGASGLSDRLAEEMQRWRGPGGIPFDLSVVGPVAWNRPLPFTPASGSLIDRARHALEVWRTVREIDRAAGGAAGGFDIRVFVFAAPLPGDQAEFAEGSGAVNGEVAFVRGSTDGDLSIPLQAIGHELLHTVGASDKYDGQGHAREPDGLADPDRMPRHPQDHAEWMVGEVTIGPGRGRLPASLAELRVGPTTAREIGWVR